MNMKIIFNLLIASFLIGCSGTTVVLVPDPDGKVGEVSLATEGGTTLLSKANESAQAPEAGQAPTQAAVLSAKKINDMFSEILANEPTPPKRYRLYFSTGSASLTAETRAEITKIIVSIQDRKSCDLSVIGHSDRVGDNKSNKGISLVRAENVAKALTDNGVDRKCMDIRYYGENDPAVPTADNVAEERNRRVEVEIR
ncbi:hypothetical protein AU255_18510 [Methyloprofundus sedimenti]|uniref:OmpA-like domain-containing protein n=1 Tax=Methyloprofundus sedimenti TaxID=1420851 RepID=A0A1V8M0R7_9GAMM|nr:OmpA family protein [Methyloprofundus sedimenti]OQK15157.1 hypothetical protein AU255_18510 [Methyloprofundus sedimenti]